MVLCLGTYRIILLNQGEQTLIELELIIDVIIIANFTITITV